MTASCQQGHRIPEKIIVSELRRQVLPINAMKRYLTSQDSNKVSVWHLERLGSSIFCIKVENFCESNHSVFWGCCNIQIRASNVLSVSCKVKCHEI